MTRVVGFDLETTGVNPFRDVPVSFAFVERPSAGLPVAVLDSGYVNPEMAIPAGATAVHGITDAMVADAPGVAETIERVASRLVDHWTSGDVIVGMNVGYDLTMVDSQCRRRGLASLEERGGVGAVVDVLVLDRRYDKWRKGGRKLSDLCRHYGVTLGHAHSAAADAEASLVLFERLKERYPACGAMALERITPTLRSWYQEWLSSFSLYLEGRGEPSIRPGRYEWPIGVDDDEVVGLEMSRFTT